MSLCSGIKMTVLADTYTVAKLTLASTVVPSTLITALCSELAAPPSPTLPMFMARSPTEFSFILAASRLQLLQPDSPVPDLATDPNWRCFMVQGPMPFDLVGIMAKLSKVLADANISLLAQSTFDTDYILVKVDDLDRAQEALNIGGVEFL